VRITLDVTGRGKDIRYNIVEPYDDVIEAVEALTSAGWTIDITIPCAKAREATDEEVKVA